MADLQKRSLLFVAVVAALSKASSGLGVEPKVEVIWHQQRFEHRERARGEGGQVNWRDVFTKKDYQLYDFTIHVHSVRGGGSEFVAYVIGKGGEFVSSATGGAAGPLFEAFKKRMEKRESETPVVRIANDNTLVIRGKTFYGTGLGNSGGNVEYTVYGLFVKTSDITKLPGRFAVAGIKGSAKDAESDKKKILANIGKPLATSGKIRVNNDYGGDLTVNLYHADVPDRVFTSWNFKGSEKSFLAISNERINIGGGLGYRNRFWKWGSVAAATGIARGGAQRRRLGCESDRYLQRQAVKNKQPSDHGSSKIVQTGVWARTLAR